MALPKIVLDFLRRESKVIVGSLIVVVVGIVGTHIFKKNQTPKNVGESKKGNNDGEPESLHSFVPIPKGPEDLLTEEAKDLRDNATKTTEPLVQIQKAKDRRK
jgi:hypothetical protein